MQHQQRYPSCQQFIICYDGIRQYWIRVVELSNVKQPRTQRVRRESVRNTVQYNYSLKLDQPICPSVLVACMVSVVPLTDTLNPYFSQPLCFRLTNIPVCGSCTDLRFNVLFPMYMMIMMQQCDDLWLKDMCDARSCWLCEWDSQMRITLVCFYVWQRPLHSLPTTILILNNESLQ